MSLHPANQDIPRDSAAAAGKPAVEPNRSATEPVQDCPLKADKPCDVDKLTLEVLGRQLPPDKATVTRKLSVKKIRRGEYIKDKVSSSARRMLGTYDMLIDVIAQPEARRNAAGAMVGGQGFYHGRACGVQKHASLTLRALGEAPELGDPAEIITNTVGASDIKQEQKQVYAISSFIDVPGTEQRDKEMGLTNVVNIFGIIMALIDSCRDKGVELRADSCGVRAKEDTTAASLALLGAVRIFRDSKFSVGIKIPPLGAYKREKIASITRSGRTDTLLKEKQAGAGYYSNKTQEQTGPNGTFAHSGTVQRGGNVDSNSLTRTNKDGVVATTFESQNSDGTGRKLTDSGGEIITDVDVDERLSRAHGFELIVSHNGTEVELGKALEKLKAYIKTIRDVLNGISDLFNALPQVGWKFTVEASVFTGTIKVDWYPEYVDQVLANGRYYAVDMIYAADFAIELLAVKLAASFGVDAQALETGLVLKVEGTLELKVAVNKEFAMNRRTPRVEVGLNTVGTAKFAVLGKVTALGTTVAEADLNITTGIEFKGKIEIEWSKRVFDLKGKLETKPIELGGFIRVPFWFDDEIDPPVRLMDGALLHEFK